MHLRSTTVPVAPTDSGIPVRAAQVLGKRILVVGINYAPEHAGIAPYTTQACEHLQRLGAEVLVLAGVPHYPHWSVPDKYRRRLRVDEVRRDGVHVRRLRHVVPARQSAARRAAYEATFGAHVLAQRLPWSPDIVLAVTPSLFGAAAAAALAARHSARLVVWVQDLMGPAAAQSGIAGGRRVARLTGQLEGQVLRRADQVMVLNQSFADHVSGLGVPRERISVRPNWSHVEVTRRDRQATRHRLGWGSEQIVVLHSGNMGLKQGLENILAAAQLAAVEAPQVRFVLMGDGSQREELQASAAGISNLEFLPPADEDVYPDYLAAADVLLVNERASAVDMSLPSKLTSYFQAGVPVVAAVPSDGGTAKEVNRSCAGIVVLPENCAGLVDAVQLIASDPARQRSMRLAGRAHALAHLGATPALTALVDDLLGWSGAEDSLCGPASFSPAPMIPGPRLEPRPASTTPPPSR